MHEVVAPVLHEYELIVAPPPGVALAQSCEPWHTGAIDTVGSSYTVPLALAVQPCESVTVTV